MPDRDPQQTTSDAELVAAIGDMRAALSAFDVVPARADALIAQAEPSQVIWIEARLVATERGDDFHQVMTAALAKYVQRHRR